MIEFRLNNRPRKRLGFITPAEVFHQSFSRVAFRALIRLIRNFIKNIPKLSFILKERQRRFISTNEPGYI